MKYIINHNIFNPDKVEIFRAGDNAELGTITIREGRYWINAGSKEVGYNSFDSAAAALISSRSTIEPDRAQLISQAVYYYKSALFRRAHYTPGMIREFTRRLNAATDAEIISLTTRLKNAVKNNNIKIK